MALIKQEAIESKSMNIFTKRGALHLADGEGVRSTLLQGSIEITEIHKKSSKNNDLENIPGRVWRLPGVSGVIRDDS